jgi:hypothetical protein
MKDQHDNKESKIIQLPVFFTRGQIWDDKGQKVCNVPYSDDSEIHQQLGREITSMINASQETSLLREENEKLKKWIASDSVYQSLRITNKSPLIDAEDDYYVDLYNLSTELRNKPLNPKQ